MGETAPETNIPSEYFNVAFLVTLLYDGVSSSALAQISSVPVQVSAAVPQTNAEPEAIGPYHTSKL